MISFVLRELPSPALLYTTLTLEAESRTTSQYYKDSVLPKIHDYFSTLIQSFCIYYLFLRTFFMLKVFPKTNIKSKASSVHPCLVNVIKYQN